MIVLRWASDRARPATVWGLTGIATLILLSAAACAPTQTSPLVKIDPPSSALGIGSTTVVTVRIENVNHLAGIEIHLTYDAAKVEVQRMDAGGFPSPDFVVQSSSSGGKIDYAIAQMPPHQPVSGGGVLLAITFKGKASGTSPLAFSSIVLADANAKQMPASLQGGTLTVGLSSQ